MSFLFKRALSTITPIASSSSSAAVPPIASLTGTLPQAVKRRREVDAAHNRTPSPKTLPPKLEAEFQSLRAAGQYKGDEASGRKAFWDKQVAWRSRLRGVTLSEDKHGRPKRIAVDEADQGIFDTVENPVGQRIYLPNVQIRLMRNYTPPNEAYDPNIATFRIPHSMTKTDLRSYLHAVYGMSVTFIRTDNYFAPLKRQQGGQIRPISGSTKSYKRAVVGLQEPFHYPDDIDELYALGEATGQGTKLGDARKEWMESHFRIEGTADVKKKALMKFHKGYRWRGKTHDNEGNVMREIMRKRGEKETHLAEEIGKMRKEVQSRE